MKKTLLPVIASLLAVVASTAYAQQQPPARRQGDAQRQDTGTAVTYRGCLTKGTQPQQYNLADEQSGHNVTFSGSPVLDNYVNQTVEISGEVVDNGGQQSFRAHSLRPVAATCKTAAQK
ncbi:MAG TPA: hypothetical protein VJ732_09310 [Bryobacteraceae bacterium]|nr:hypothetical protein [Bryobacteraceae bacterium]